MKYLLIIILILTVLTGCSGAARTVTPENPLYINNIQQNTVNYTDNKPTQNGANNLKFISKQQISDSDAIYNIYKFVDSQNGATIYITLNPRISNNSPSVAVIK